ncbi:hypothetical protein MRX96_025403 [Rhipicephalus microplus]
MRKVGDEFMRQIEPIAAYVPYMTAVGNHESKYNFSNYANRFSMMDKSGTLNNFFYSFNIGPAHIISYSTEFYFYLKYGWQQGSPAISLVREKPPGGKSTRKQRLQFRRKYCSQGISPDKDHSYERLWPVYDGVVYKGNGTDPYVNPEGTCTRRHRSCRKLGEPLAFRDESETLERCSNFRLWLHEAPPDQQDSHSSCSRYQPERNQKVVDSVYIVKDKPRNF